MMEILMSMDRAVINAAIVITVLDRESRMYRLANLPSIPNRKRRRGERSRLEKMVKDGIMKDIPMRMRRADRKPKKGF
jgi:hypothetical protein